MPKQNYSSTVDPMAPPSGQNTADMVVGIGHMIGIDLVKEPQFLLIAEEFLEPGFLKTGKSSQMRMARPSTTTQKSAALKRRILLFCATSKCITRLAATPNE